MPNEKELNEFKTDLSQEANGVITEIEKAVPELQKAFTDWKEVKAKHKPEDEEYKTAFATLQKLQAEQDARQKSVDEIETMLKLTEIPAIKTAGKPATVPQLESALKGQLREKETKSFGHRLFEAISAQKMKFESIKGASVHAGSETLPDGSIFTPVATFGGYNPADFTDEDILDMFGGLGQDYIKSRDNYRANPSAFKSMFAAHPDAGGDGSLFNPDTEIIGATGALLEMGVDTSDLGELPYDQQGILEILRMQKTTKPFEYYMRQSHRLSRASVVMESVTTPPVNLLKQIPENEYGWVRLKASVYPYAAMIPMGEDFLQDARPLVDAIEGQLQTDVLRKFGNSAVNGVNVAPNPDMVGLMNIAGTFTRIHRGATSAGLGANPTAGLATDDERETIERAIEDLRVIGVKASHSLVSNDVYQKMLFAKYTGGDQRRKYTQAEVDTIMKAKTVEGSEVAANKTLVGDFNNAVKGMLRQGLLVQIGVIDKMFLQRMVVMRCVMRGGIKVRKSYAFNRVTFP